MDITAWMVRREQVVPVVWGKFYLMFERAAVGDSQVNVTVQVVLSMEGLVRVGMLKGVAEEDPTMVREAGHVPKVGLGVRREV